MKKLLKKISIWPLMLAAVAVLLCARNYTPDTWLSGWDTLHPEFNLALNFQRVINGVWRQEQGLGALAGHAHLSELPRILFLWISSLVFPASFLRYFFFYVCLILGPLGVYFYLQKNNFKKIPSFFGGLFYLLNLGTLQHFFVPFEMFAVLYAALPWLLLLAGKFLEKGEKKHLLWFAVVTIFSSSMAYASVLWFAYFGFLALFLLTNIFLTKGKFWKRGFILLVATLILNFYWLLPNLYFLFSSAGNVTETKTNLMFSERAFLIDKKYANFSNVALLKGFLFDWQKYDGGKFTFLLKDWKEHLSSPVMSVVGYAIFSVVFLGILTTVVKKDKRGLTILSGFIFAFIFLIHGIFILETIFTFLRDHLDIFKESLRFPWTKFSIFVMFGYSVFFALGLEQVFKIFKHKKVLTTILSIFVSALLAIWMLPAFKGKLISPLMRIKIPSEYFKMYKWFEQKPKDERIAVLPLLTYWGWEYYRFGFEGAGFVWFGLKQPVLVRDFDRWQPENENFYWELSYAIDSKNDKSFENVFEKYNVSWIMLDGNIISPSWPMALNTDEIEKFISNSSRFELAEEIGKIKIYKVNLETPAKDFVYLAENLPVVNEYQWSNVDFAYGELGNYISVELDAKRYTLDAYYPFRSLFTGRKTEELDIEIENLGNKVVFKKKLPEGLENYLIELPKNYDGKELVEIEPVTYDTKYFIPTIDSDGKTISVSFPKIKGLLSTEINPSSQNIEAKNCNQFASGKVSNLISNTQDGEILRLSAEDANNCSASFWLPNLSHKYSYLISSRTKNVSGKPLLFWLENLTNRKADTELYLNIPTSYVIQPSMAQDGLGYILHFDNISIGRQKTVNELGKIEVNLIPYRFLTELRLTADDSQLTANSKKQSAISDKLLAVNHPNPSLYEIKIERLVGDNTTLVLSQAFHSGWLAFDLDKKKEIKDHVLVNNWANGWQLPANSSQLKANSIILVFWPQYLQWAGLGLLLICFVLISIKNYPIRLY